VSYGTTEQVAEKFGSLRKNAPQGLKAQPIPGIYGSAEAEPFQSKAFFGKL
jgi:hypothetical protein